MTIEEHKKMYRDSLVTIKNEDHETQKQSLKNLETFFGPDVWKDLESYDFDGHLYAPKLIFKGHRPIQVCGKTDKPTIFMYNYIRGIFWNHNRSFGKALVKSETPLTKIKNFLR